MSDATADHSGDELANMLLTDVASLVYDSRDTHGDAVVNQAHIGQGWTWYLQGQGLLAEDAELTGSDVARMMELLKMSRACVGDYDVDHDRDIAGYAGIAAACAVTRGEADVDELMVTEDD